ncbi:hypothetical protein C8Q77DRAFT_1050190 [Trametes polyzona]|nr:hypothetical protein C8Q77DRAFT_1050190 [Trametes polyzona]
MPFVLPTIEQIEDYLQQVEDVVVSSLSSASPDLSRVSEAVHRLWQDVLRHSPQAMPGLKGLGAFEVPPPPPPPPPPKSFWENTAVWVADHPWQSASIGVGILGTTLLVGYVTPRMRRHAKARAKKHPSAMGGERKQVVVVLGGDSPLGLPLVQDLEKKGYIVITSVSTPEAVEEVESRCHGYVRALVLDPNEPEMIPYFLRSLASTMSRRFPINAAGDPHAPPTAHLYLHSVVSLLSLPSHSITPPPGPFEHLNLHGDYLPYLQATHIVPLQVLQALLPLLRATPARAKDARTNGLGRQSIIVCLPATDARVGLPFASAQAMSAAATLRAVEVLRREIRAAGLSGFGSDTAESMRNIQVTTVDVGVIGPVAADESPEDLNSVVGEWTPSEQAAYSAAFGSMLEHSGHPAIRRQPTHVANFVATVVDVVSGGRKNRHPMWSCGLRRGLGIFHELIRGDRVVVGAGAGTYALASYLPAFVLDALLNVPYILVGIRNALLPIPPRVIEDLPPTATSAAASAPQAQPPAQPPVVQQTIQEKHEGTDSEPEHESSEAGSEADVESNSGVGESWISLKSKPSDSNASQP